MASIKDDSHLTSAAAFVEGGLQDCCDDACSICLETFTESDPSTVTTCKHEFHLQCILEWCQRSSQCPMCWQPVILKDPINQELLEAVELERNLRSRRNASIFHYPALGDFELQHLPVGSDESELEERIIRHLAAAAAARRVPHISSREGQRVRPANTHILVLSTQSGLPPSVGIPARSPPHVGGAETTPATVSHTGSVRTSGLYVAPPSGSRSPQSNPNGAEPEFQSFSESLKSRFNAAITRHKELIAKSTRGWKERLFSRGNSMGDTGSGAQREVESVSRAAERLQVGEATAGGGSLAPNDPAIPDTTNVSSDADAPPSRV